MVTNYIKIFLTEKRKLLEAAQANAMRILGTNTLELPESVKPILSTMPQSKWEIPETRVRHDSERTQSQVGIRVFLFFFFKENIPPRFFFCFFQQRDKLLSLKYVYLFVNAVVILGDLFKIMAHCFKHSFAQSKSKLLDICCRPSVI